MAHARNYGKRFSGGQISEVHQPIQGRNRYMAPGHVGWWTPERITKLAYVMNKYDDIDKAARVLGCPRGLIVREIYHLRDEQPDLIPDKRIKTNV